jgi:hypothetical protein
MLPTDVYPLEARQQPARQTKIEDQELLLCVRTICCDPSKITFISLGVCDAGTVGGVPVQPPTDRRLAPARCRTGDADVLRA